MKTDEILNLDFRNEENQEVIQKVLKKIKPLAKYSEEDEVVPLEAIEKLIRVLSSKYEVRPQFMMFSLEDPIRGVYSIGVKTTNDHKWLGDVHGMCLYEVFAKLGIKMFAEIKSGNIVKKTTSKDQRQRDKIVKRIEEEEEE